MLGDNLIKCTLKKLIGSGDFYIMPSAANPAEPGMCSSHSRIGNSTHKSNLFTGNSRHTKPYQFEHIQILFLYIIKLYTIELYTIDTYI